MGASGVGSFYNQVMNHRTLILTALSSSFAAGLIGLACSSPSSTPLSAPAEAGADATTTPGADASDKDQGAPPPADAGVKREGGGCSPATGPCDLVLQDCPDKGGVPQECVVTSGVGGTLSTRCVAAQQSQQLPLGRECCPSDTANPCLPGLECIGAPCGPDAGAGRKSGRCSPHCCPGDNAACGVSVPEGIAGACEVNVTVGGKPAYQVCSYKERCKVFGLEPCKSPNTACTVQDKVGTSTCEPIFNPPPALAHQPCGNGCIDGTMCFLKSDGGNECLWLCHKPLTALPGDYDAGGLGTAPGKGGCPAGESCTGNLSAADFPVWLSICR